MLKIVRIGLPACALALALGVGAARADVSGLVGATVVGTTTDGLTRRIQLHADGTYLITVSDGERSSGTWSLEGTKLCYRSLDPKPAAGGAKPLCVEGLDGHKPGDVWMTTGHHGLAMKMTVVRGQ